MESRNVHTQIPGQINTPAKNPLPNANPDRPKFVEIPIFEFFESKEAPGPRFGAWTVITLILNILLWCWVLALIISAAIGSRELFYQDLGLAFGIPLIITYGCYWLFLFLHPLKSLFAEAVSWENAMIRFEELRKAEPLIKYSYSCFHYPPTGKKLKIETHKDTKQEIPKGWKDATTPINIEYLSKRQTCFWLNQFLECDTETRDNINHKGSVLDLQNRKKDTDFSMQVDLEIRGTLIGFV